jgi:hypothetical protein
MFTQTAAFHFLIRSFVIKVPAILCLSTMKGTRPGGSAEFSFPFTAPV